MSKTPNLQVPESKVAPRGRSGVSGLTIMLLLVLLVVQVLSIFVSGGSRGGRSSDWGSGAASLGPEREKALAAKLESVGLNEQAAEAWEVYLSLAEPEDFEAGTIRFRIGKLHQADDNYAEALAQYYLAEVLLADSSTDLTDELNSRVLECLRRLGRYADLAREVAARASGEPSATIDDANQVVAQIGDEKITVVDFDRMLTNEIELAVKSRMGRTAEEEVALRKRFHKQFEDPQAKAQQLLQLVTSRVLADEARKQKLNESKEFRERMMSMVDGILASTLLYQEANKRATVTDADVERFYEANMDRYAEQPATFFAHILCRDKDHAENLISRIKAGESFDDLVKTESRDSNTKQKLGIIGSPVTDESEYVPMFGTNEELHGALRGGEAGKILDMPYESNAGWHVIKIVSHRARVERPLEEIRDQVRQDTIEARRREVTDQYIKQLLDESGVEFYPQVFQGKPQEEAAETGESKAL